MNLDSSKAVATEYDDYRGQSVRINNSRVLLYVLAAIFASGCMADLRLATLATHDHTRSGQLAVDIPLRSEGGVCMGYSELEDVHGFARGSSPSYPNKFGFSSPLIENL